MPFDEIVLVKTIDDLKSAIDGINQKKSILDDFLRSLVSISDEEYHETDETSHRRKILKRRRKDDKTGLVLTDSRRDEIFDACVPKAKAEIAKIK